MCSNSRRHPSARIFSTISPAARPLVLQFIDQCRAENLPPYYIYHCLTPIKKLAHEATMEGLIDPAVLMAIERIPSPKVTPLRLGQWIDEAGIVRLMSAPNRSTLIGKRDVVLLGLLLYCGLRREEVTRVEFKHIRIVDGRPAICDLIGKGDKSRRIPMPQWLFDAMQEWTLAAGLQGGRILRPMRPPRARFVDKDIPEMSVWGVHDAFKKYAEQIGQPGLTAHDMRRTLGRVARKKGVELDQIQQTYGHSDLATTQRYIGDNQSFVVGETPADALPVPEWYQPPTS
jgi:integrase